MSSRFPIKREGDSKGAKGSWRDGPIDWNDELFRMSDGESGQGWSRVVKGGKKVGSRQ